jgi:phage terminase large subunit-like protein
VAERNFGGDMVESTLRTVRRDLPLRLVTASRGKHVRFEPVAALFEQGRLHIVGSMPELEDEVTAFTPNGYEGQGSPNRADALVWAVLDLVGRRGVSAADLYSVPAPA